MRRTAPDGTECHVFDGCWLDGTPAIGGYTVMEDAPGDVFTSTVLCPYCKAPLLEARIAAGRWARVVFDPLVVPLTERQHGVHRVPVWAVPAPAGQRSLCCRDCVEMFTLPPGAPYNGVAR